MTVARPPLAEVPATLQITDHALVRYLERVCGVDMDAARKAMVGADDWAAIKHVPNGIYPVVGSAGSGGGRGHRIRVKENTVVTVLPGSGG